MARTDGFVRLPNWMIDDSDLSLFELAVYIVLLRFRNPKTGKWTVGMSTIADRARVSRETVKRVIPKLEHRGLIRVVREKRDGRNSVNIYEVALPAKEAPEHIRANTARGSRIPKRTKGRHSETLPRHSETLKVGTPRPSKKTTTQKTIEEDVTLTFSESEHESFSFDLPDSTKATEKQVAYLKDLAIHIGYQTGGGIPNEAQLQRWRKLTREEADNLIAGYKKALGRPEDGIYPEPGDPEYDALSTAGQEFAESGGDPGSVWEYGWAGKENSA